MTGNETDNHEYNKPEKGTTDWHVPLNENFDRIDADVEVRDEAANIEEYEPRPGAKFLALDTGTRYRGTGDQWEPLPAPGLADELRVENRLSIPTKTEDPSDPDTGDLWFREDEGALKLQTAAGTASILVGDGTDEEGNGTGGEDEEDDESENEEDDENEDEDGEPAVETGNILSVGEESAELEGIVESIGEYEELELYFDYRPMGSDEWSWQLVAQVSAGGTYTDRVDDLDPDTEYEWRAGLWEDVSTEVTLGSHETFTTDAVDPDEPAIETGDALSVGEESAELEGIVESVGEYEELELYFDYRPMGSDEWSWQLVDHVGGSGTYTDQLDGLRSGTEYEWRAGLWEDVSTEVTLGSHEMFTTDESDGEGLSDADTVIPFDTEDDLNEFTSLDAGNLSIVDNTLEVLVAEGTHYGTHSTYHFDQRWDYEPETLYARYLLYFDQSWEPNDSGKLPGPEGLHGSGGLGGGRPDPDTWSARGMFNNAGSGSIDIGYYVYHSGQGGTYGDHDWWNVSLSRGEWYEIEQYIELNDPGQANGVLRGWINGSQEFERTNYTFRESGYDDGIRGYLFNVYHGGGNPAPRNMYLYFDHLELSDGSRMG